MTSPSGPSMKLPNDVLQCRRQRHSAKRHLVATSERVHFSRRLPMIGPTTASERNGNEQRRLCTLGVPFVPTQAFKVDPGWPHGLLVALTRSSKLRKASKTAEVAPSEKQGQLHMRQSLDSFGCHCESGIAEWQLGVATGQPWAPYIKGARAEQLV